MMYFSNVRSLSLIFTLTLMLTSSAKAVEAGKCALVEPPTTPVELIKNIQCAIAQNIFLDDDIFTNDERLWKLTGGHEFFKDFPQPKHIEIPRNSFRMDRVSVDIHHFPSSIEKVTDGEYPNWLNRMNIGITKGIVLSKPNSPLATNLSLGNATGLQLDFDDVVKLLGPDWKRVEELRVDATANNSLPPEKEAATHKTKLIPAYAIQYQIPAQPPMRAGILVHFDEYGYLQDLTFSESK